MDFAFVIFCAGLGIGLAMDAFSVSLADGLHEPCMKRKKIFLIAIVFAIFQGLMPLIGWFCVHSIAEKFKAFEPFIPWIALALLLYIGIGMIREGFCKEDEACSCNETLGFTALIIQGIATSIDALSVGFTIAEYGALEALAAAAIIAGLTFAICYSGVVIGKNFGTKFSGKASIFGGAILIFIGLEIFITGIL